MLVCPSCKHKLLGKDPGRIVCEWGTEYPMLVSGGIATFYRERHSRILCWIPRGADFGTPMSASLSLPRR